MSLVSLLTLGCGVLILLTGYRVFLLDSKRSEHRIFLMIAIISSWMCFCWYEMSQTDVLSEAILYFKMKGVWIILFPLSAYLIWSYTGGNQRKINPWLKYGLGLLIFLPTFYFLYIESFTSLRNGDVIEMQNGAWGLKLGSMDLLAFLRASWVLLIGIVSSYLFQIFYKEEREKQKRIKKRNAMILFVICITVSFVQNNILPYCGVILPINESLTTFFGVGLFGWLVIGFRLSELEPSKGMDKVIDSMTNLMILTDERYVVQKINPAALQFFEVEELETLGESLEELMDSNTVESIKKLNLEGKGKNDKEFVFKRHDGLAYLLLSSSPIYNKKHKLVGYALVGADLTKHKFNERMLSFYTKRIRKADEQLKHFAYITSHDLKEPLRNISNYTTKLERELPALEGHVQEYFGFITEGVKRMYNIIESIKDVSEISNSKDQSILVDTSHLVGKIEEKLQNVILERGAVIKKSALPKIVGNPNHFELLFFNLIENGLKYNQSERPLIGISCHMEEGRFVFSIEDNGIGVEPEFLEYIFKMFKRLHSRASYDGVGMGLAICKSVVEKNGGRIWAESSEYDGTTIKFTLPRIKSNTYPLIQRKLSAVMV